MNRTRPNQTMKPTAPPRNALSVFATTPCRGLSLYRYKYVASAPAIRGLGLTSMIVTAYVLRFVRIDVKRSGEHDPVGEWSIAIKATTIEKRRMGQTQTRIRFWPQPRLNKSGDRY